MTPAVSSSTTSGRAAGGGRVQGVLALASMAAAVVVTVVLVATPASSVGSGAAAATSAPAAGSAPLLPAGLRVDVQGGDPLDAHALADRLAGAGATVRAVAPARSGDGVAGRTTIVYYDRRSMAAADRLRSLLGSGTLQRRQVFQPEVDVTIVLGKDLPRL